MEPTADCRESLLSRVGQYCQGRREKIFEPGSVARHGGPDVDRTETHQQVVKKLVQVNPACYLGHRRLLEVHSIRWHMLSSPRNLRHFRKS